MKILYKKTHLRLHYNPRQKHFRIVVGYGQYGTISCLGYIYLNSINNLVLHVGFYNKQLLRWILKHQIRITPQPGIFLFLYLYCKNLNMRHNRYIRGG